MIESLLAAQRDGVAGDQVKGRAAAVEVAARPSVPLFRVTPRCPAARCRTGGRVILPHRHQAAAVHLKLAAVGEAAARAAQDQGAAAVVGNRQRRPAVAHRTGQFEERARGDVERGRPLRVVLPVKFSTPPPITFKVLVLLKERLPVKFTVPRWPIMMTP